MKPVDVTGKKSFSSRFFQDYIIYVILIALIIVMSLLNNNFFTVNNLVNLLRQVSVYAILAFGMTFVMISGGIDLSVGSVVALSGCIATISMVKGGCSIWIGLIISIGVGALCGFLNGIMISKLKIPFFLATVAMMYIARGLALILTHETPISGLPDEIKIFGGTVDFPIPPQLIIAIIVFIVLLIILNRTKLGRYTFALGSNEQTCKLSGVKVDKYKILIYTVSGICAGIVGIIMVARLKVGSPIIADGFEMDAICAVAIGGTSILGGSGSVVKSLAGAVVLSVISIGLNILGVSSSTQSLIKGLLIVVVVAVDMLRRTRNANG